MDKTWETKAALYELLAKTFLLTEREIVQALILGEYGGALAELIAVNDLQAEPEKVSGKNFEWYYQSNEDEVFHRLRKEYTRLYVGAKGPLIIPYAGTWQSAKQGQTPLLFVGKESMAIERFMRSNGIVHATETNNPLDHIGSMLEFLMYLCVLETEASEGLGETAASSDAYTDFYKMHFIEFAHAFAKETIKESNEEFFRVGAYVLLALPNEPL